MNKLMIFHTVKSWEPGMEHRTDLSTRNQVGSATVNKYRFTQKSAYKSHYCMKLFSSRTALSPYVQQSVKTRHGQGIRLENFESWNARMQNKSSKVNFGSTIRSSNNSYQSPVLALA